MKELTPMEFKNEKIMTSEQLAEVYNTDAKNISNNFNRNKGKFIEGKHYYFLQGKELKEFKTNHLKDEPSMLRINQLYLWTERGVARHAKILETDEAWDVYEILEDTYFRAKEIVQNQELSFPEDKIIKVVEENIQKMDNAYKNYYRPPHKSKIQLCNYIKRRMGIDKINDDYKLVKDRILLVLGAKKWEDVSIDKLLDSIDLVDKSIDIVMDNKNYKQIDFIDNLKDIKNDRSTIN